MFERGAVREGQRLNPKEYRSSVADQPCHDRKTASVDGGFGNPMRRVGGSRVSTLPAVDRPPMDFSCGQNWKSRSVVKPFALSGV